MDTVYLALTETIYRSEWCLFREEASYQDPSWDNSLWSDENPGPTTTIRVIQNGRETRLSLVRAAARTCVRDAYKYFENYTCSYGAYHFAHRQQQRCGSWREVGGLFEWWGVVFCSHRSGGKMTAARTLWAVKSSNVCHRFWLEHTHTHTHTERESSYFTRIRSLERDP